MVPGSVPSVSPMALVRRRGRRSRARARTGSSRPTSGRGRGRPSPGGGAQSPGAASEPGGMTEIAREVLEPALVLTPDLLTYPGARRPPGRAARTPDLLTSPRSRPASGPRLRTGSCPLFKEKAAPQRNKVREERQVTRGSTRGSVGGLSRPFPPRCLSLRALLLCGDSSSSRRPTASLRRFFLFAAADRPDRFSRGYSRRSGLGGEPSGSDCSLPAASCRLKLGGYGDAPCARPRSSRSRNSSPARYEERTRGPDAT